MAEELNTYNLQLQQVEAALTSEPDNQVSSGGEILKIYKNTEEEKTSWSLKNSNNPSELL